MTVNTKPDSEPHFEDGAEYPDNIEADSHSDGFGSGKVCPKCQAHEVELVTPEILDARSNDPTALWVMRCNGCGLSTGGYRGSMKAMDAWDVICSNYKLKK